LFDCARHLTIYSFNRDNDPASEIRIAPNSTIHLVNAVSASQVITREHQHCHASAILNHVHLANYSSSCLKALTVDSNICPASPEAWNETLPDPFAFLVTIAYED
jgi:hypothetical protein